MNGKMVLLLGIIIFLAMIIIVYNKSKKENSLSLSWNIDFLCSSSLQDILKTKISACLSNSASHISSDLMMLKKEYPIIKKIQVVYGSKKIHTTIAAAEPWLMLNNDSIICHDGAVVPSCWFEPTSLNTISCFTCNYPISVMPEAYYRWFRDISTLIDCEHYDIIIDNPTMIWLRNKNYNFSILCGTDTQFDAHLLSYCQHAYTIMHQHKERRAIKWVADVRFDKQIILYQIREGRT